jgi:hypothetical protein
MNNEPVAWKVWNRMGGISLRFTKPDDSEYVEYDPLYTHPTKTLTDEEINQLWAESHEDGIAIQQGFTTQQHYFARAILRKAQEK